MILKLLN